MILTRTATLRIEPFGGAAAREIAAEHAVLTRQLAGLQNRLSEQVRQHVQYTQLLEGEVVQLRAQLIVTRTGMLWGLSTSGVVRTLPRRARPPTAVAEVAAMAEASQVICQTGCVGHSHPWLEAGGHCRRTGDACEHMAATRMVAGSQDLSTPAAALTADQGG